MKEPIVNRCLKCSFWDTDTKFCSYGECKDCVYEGDCDDQCAGDECKFGNVNEVDPKTWNPDYNRERGV